MTSYWFTDICALFNSFSINPFSSGDKNFQYNSLTRLIILVTILAALKFPENNTLILSAGAFSILLTLCIYFLTLNSSKSIESRTIGNVSTEYSNDEYIGGITNIGKNMIDDYNTNTKNSFLINHPSLNTDDIKHKFILQGDKTPKHIGNEIIEKPEPNIFAQQVMTGTVKQLNSLQEKNISPV